ncbi:histidine kinase [Halomicrococcus sp. SG-WS-1]|uniref:histidine kinase n=1 Tax=Halomicrococcus sp. SG-WS-1 TaxID=3439057 RepID=UPI003F794EB5
MASETETAVRRETGTVDWTSAVLAGVGAGIAMGLLIQFVMGIMPVIGALYGVESLAAGWIAHLLHSVAFALVFAAVVSRPPLSKYAESTASVTGLGLAYGVVLWLVAAAIVMPIWMGLVGLPSPGVPNVNPQSLVGHLVYGVLLGGLYAALSR